MKGNASPNIRIPMRTGMGIKSRQLTPVEIHQVLALIGDGFLQDAQAASIFKPVEGGGDTKSIFIKRYKNLTEEKVEAIEKMLNKKTGLEFSLNNYPKQLGFSIRCLAD